MTDNGNLLANDVYAKHGEQNLSNTLQYIVFAAESDEFFIAVSEQSMPHQFGIFETTSLFGPENFKIYIWLLHKQNY